MNKLCSQNYHIDWIKSVFRKNTKMNKLYVQSKRTVWRMYEQIYEKGARLSSK